MKFSVIFITIGFILIIGSILSIIRKRNQISKSNIVRGFVKEIRQKSVYDDVVNLPVVEYSDENNPEKKCYYEFENGDNFSNYNIGDELDLILYNNGIKTKVYINSWFKIWFVETFALPLGIIFFMFGIIMW